MTRIGTRKSKGLATYMERQGAVTVLRLEGRLDMLTAPHAQEFVRETISRGHLRVVIDMDGVRSVDASGLCALIMGLKMARRSHGDMRLARLRAQPHTVLEVTGLNRVLVVHESVDEARAALETVLTGT